MAFQSKLKELLFRLPDSQSDPDQMGTGRFGKFKMRRKRSDSSLSPVSKAYLYLLYGKWHDAMSTLGRFVLLMPYGHAEYPPGDPMAALAQLLTDMEAAERDALAANSQSHPLAASARLQ